VVRDVAVTLVYMLNNKRMYCIRGYVALLIAIVHTVVSLLPTGQLYVGAEQAALITCMFAAPLPHCWHSCMERTIKGIEV
jgi:hypothetical protein